MSTSCSQVLAVSVLLVADICLGQTQQFREPWNDHTKAIVIDLYEDSEIDWGMLATDPRVVGVIHRATTGVLPDREFEKRREEARNRGYRWGSLHVGTPIDPVKQADFYLSVAKPSDDEVIALDLECVEASNCMTITQASAFIRRIKEKTGRYPMVYANHYVTTQISATRVNRKVFSETKLWYARFRKTIPSFPNRVWNSYTLWQFSSEINCNELHRNACLYRAPGTNYDMDISVYNGSIGEMRKNWPFSQAEPSGSADLYLELNPENYIK